MAADEIRVKVGFEDVFDLFPPCFCAVDIGLHFTQRVYDDGFVAALDVVCALGETSGVDLFDFHGYNFRFKDEVINLQTVLFGWRFAVVGCSLALAMPPPHWCGNVPSQSAP